MIIDERYTAYINSLDRGNSDIVRTIEKEALKDHVPIIRRETGSLLKVLLRMVKPKRVLEVGTAVGFSAILMSECLGTHKYSDHNRELRQKNSRRAPKFQAGRKRRCDYTA